MNRMALFSLAAFAIDTVVFDLLPNGVSAVLSNRRAERISRQQTFAQMALRSALGALWFRSLDKDASGYVTVQDASPASRAPAAVLDVLGPCMERVGPCRRVWAHRGGRQGARA